MLCSTYKWPCFTDVVAAIMLFSPSLLRNFMTCRYETIHHPQTLLTRSAAIIASVIGGYCISHLRTFIVYGMQPLLAIIKLTANISVMKTMVLLELPYNHSFFLTLHLFIWYDVSLCVCSFRKLAIPVNIIPYIFWR